MESISEFNRSTEIDNFLLSVLLGDMDVSEFYTYAGSLTTPPCSQAVTWVVFSHAITITPSQMKRFRRLSDGHGAALENNYRALQAKGNRRVFLRRKRKVLESLLQSPLYWELLNKLKPQGQTVANDEKWMCERRHSAGRRGAGATQLKSFIAKWRLIETHDISLFANIKILNICNLTIFQNNYTIFNKSISKY